MTMSIFCGMVVDYHNEGELACVTNARKVAHQAWEGAPEDVPITGWVVLLGDGREWNFQTGERKWSSATFAAAACGEGDEVVIDDQLIDHLADYMGEHVMQEARDPSGDKHTFVRAVLAAKGGTITIVRKR